MKCSKYFLYVVCGILCGLLLSGTAAAQNSVTLYDQTNFQGQSEAFTGNDANLADNAIGNKTLWSIRVPAGCQAALYELDNFKGDVEAFRADDENLGDNRIENESIKSIKVACKGSRSVQQPGVTLFESPDFSGEQEFFALDDPDLKDNLPGRTPVGSIQLSTGCQAILYEREDFQGDEEKFTANDADLRDNMVENGFIRSMRVSCPSSGAARSSAPAKPAQNTSEVVLFSGEKYTGTREGFHESDPNLSDNPIGNNTVSSVMLPKDCKAKLYEHPQYKGKSVLIKRNTASLSGTAIGNDEAGSIEVFCD